MATNRFYPRRREVSAITNASPCVVTFSDADHDFTVGEYVSFRVTPDFGMVEIDHKRGLILAIGATDITVDIDTTTWTAFDISQLDAVGTTPPTCVPVASGVISGVEPIATSLIDIFDNRRI